MSYDPLQAPARKERDESTFTPFRNVVKLVSNEVTDMPLSLKQASGIGADVYTPFWEIVYEAHDVQLSDGTPLRGGKTLSFGSRLYDKNGDALDETQRPYVCAAAFAGLNDGAGVTVFPDSEYYDADEVIGRSFVVEATKFATGRPVPIPVEDLGMDFEYDGAVKVLPARGERGSTPVQVSDGEAVTHEIIGDAKLTKSLTSIVGGATTESEATKNLLASGFGRGMTLNGQGLNGVAIKGQLLATLGELGLV